MGFSDIERMRNGLKTVKKLRFPRIGTITLDSYTRTRNFLKAQQLIDTGGELNGYPIVNNVHINHFLLRNIQSSNFPIQVRHGSTEPYEIFASLIKSGIDATEGGPISYCLPYSRRPLVKSFQAWHECLRKYSEIQEKNVVPHIESFGGGMMGQLCPPSLLVAITIIECMWFSYIGLSSISVSYSQGTNITQDIGALQALRLLCRQFFKKLDWHVVLYTFMGIFPKSTAGAKLLIEDSIRIARYTRTERVIVKTAAEAHQIPSIKQNIDALNWASETKAPFMDKETILQKAAEHKEIVYQQARTLIDVVLNLDSDIEKAILKAFSKGYWDVPYCIHPDNKNNTRAALDDEGNIIWWKLGKIPLTNLMKYRCVGLHSEFKAKDFLHMLTFNQRKYDKNYKSN
jgi:methylaspartate mutase epsilon subunit